MNNEQIARVCHAANAEFCRTIGDDSQKSWEEAEQWQRDSAIKGVGFTLDNPLAPESAQHEAWMSDKAQQGWIWGVEKNAVLKTHPCMVPYHALPVEQRLKDYLFRAVVSAFIRSESE